MGTAADPDIMLYSSNVYYIVLLALLENRCFTHICTLRTNLVWAELDNDDTQKNRQFWGLFSLTKTVGCFACTLRSMFFILPIWIRLPISWKLKRWLLGPGARAADDNWYFHHAFSALFVKYIHAHGIPMSLSRLAVKEECSHTHSWLVDFWNKKLLKLLCNESIKDPVWYSTRSCLYSYSTKCKIT